MPVNPPDRAAQHSGDPLPMRDAPPAHAPSARGMDTIASLGVREMACPVCGHAMPDLKGGKATICPLCGFKDSCCY